MTTDTLRKRHPQPDTEPNPGFGSDKPSNNDGAGEHPAGKVKYGVSTQVLRAILLLTWFNCCCIVINVTQFLGSPLYFISQNYYYAYMALTKQSFGIMTTAGTRWFSPTPVRVSWDPSLRGQFRKTEDGKLETTFPERLVLISNHQVYTEWLYLWWVAYTSRMHGHIFIILKESLKYVPVLGPGMMFYGFIFMARKWIADKPRLQHRLDKLKTRHSGPMSGSAGLDPMWLLIFPEGTNLSKNTRLSSARWAEKQGLADLKYQLLPRSTGLFFCLQQLKGTVDWVYDCTIAYEGTPKGGYAQDYFTIRSCYLQGRPSKCVNMYWRRFALSDIPLDDPKSFEAWLSERWKEKDALLEQWHDTGRFPADLDLANEKTVLNGGYIETEIQLRRWDEIGQIFVVLAAFGLLANVVTKLFQMFFS